MKVLIGLGMVGAIALLLELILRLGYGLGKPPLYIGDDHIGYLLAPNQQLKRFGNRILINEYSMRAQAIAPLPEADTLRIFLLGDSLANGNWWTDQNDILSERIARLLEPALASTLKSAPASTLESAASSAASSAALSADKAPYHRIEALNASANSWGPRNELAYLERYGTFGAHVLVLLLNTDDLFGTQPTALQVGRDRSYPSHNPPSALAEVFSKIVFSKMSPNPPIAGLEAIQNERGDRVGKNIAAVAGIHQLMSAQGGQLILVLSPLKRELASSRDYELTARDRLRSWAHEHQVHYLDLLDTYRNYQPEPESLYRDHIHLSPAGNDLVGEAIAQAISEQL